MIILIKEKIEQKLDFIKTLELEYDLKVEQDVEYKVILICLFIN